MAVALQCVRINKTKFLIYEVEKDNLLTPKSTPQSEVQHHKHVQLDVSESLRSNPSKCHIPGLAPTPEPSSSSVYASQISILRLIHYRDPPPLSSSSQDLHAETPKNVRAVYTSISEEIRRFRIVAGSEPICGPRRNEGMPWKEVYSNEGCKNVCL